MNRLLLVLCCAISLHAAIAFDTVVNGSSSAGTSLTYAHTITGTNNLLVVGVVGDVISNDPTCVHITSVTYNSVTLTQIDKALNGGARCNYLYVLANAPSGTHNVVVTVTVAQIGAMSASYTGVASTSPVDVHNSGISTSATSLSVAVTPSIANEWVVYFATNGVGVNTSNNGNTTIRHGGDIYGSSSISDSNGIRPAGSPTTMSVIEGGGATTWGGVAIAIKPFLSGSVPQGYFF